MCNNSVIEKVNDKFCKYLLGVHKYSSNLAVKGELGSHGLLIDCILHSVKYWLRFCEEDMDRTSLVHKSYEENLRLLSAKPNVDSWSLHEEN